MTKQVINTGSAANDGTGDTLRAAAQKINSNFTEVYDTSQASFNQANTAVNNAAGASQYANSAFNQANTAVNNAAGASLYANGAFIKSNTALTHAQAAYNYANTIVSDTQIDPVARTTANNASNNITTIAGVNVTQNTNITTATNTSTAAFIQANTAVNDAASASLYANASFFKANSATTLAQEAYNFANTIISDTQVDPVARSTANNASNNITEIQGVNVTQNTNITTATNTSTAAFIQANSASLLAQAAFNYSNTITSWSGTDELVGDGYAIAVGSKLDIANDGSGGLIGWSSQALSVAYDANIISTYPVGSTITFQDGTTATITGWDDYGPTYIDLFWDTPKTGTLFPITLKTVNYVAAAENTARISVTPGAGGTAKQWTFAADGNLTFPDNSVQANAGISIVVLKTLVANSTDFTDFKSKIAGL